MRKVLSMLLALAMVLSAVGTMAFAAGEDLQKISEVELILPSEPTPGEKLCDPALVAVNEGAPYTIVDVHWEILIDGNWESYTDDPCRVNQEYMLSATLAPMEGYAFDQDCVSIVNGIDNGYCYVDDSGNLKVFHNWWHEPYTLEFVELQITGDAVGANVADIEVAYPEDALYQVDGLVIEAYDYESGSYVPYEGLITADKLFRVTVQLSCPENYMFYGANYSVNDEYTDPNILDYTIAEVYYYIANMERIEVVEVVGVTAPVAGQAPDFSGLKVDEDAPYEVLDAIWLNEYDEPVEGVFEDKNAYYLMIQVGAKEGYQFDELVYATLDGEDVDLWDSNLSNIVLRARYSLKDKITQVDITDLEVPVPGQTPDTEITVSNADKIEEAWIDWYDYEIGTYDFDAFAEKGIYEANITLRAQEDFDFAEDAVVTINGEVCDVTVNGDYLYIYKVYALGYEIIDKLEVTAPKIQAGQDPADAVFTFPEDIEVVEHLWAVSADGTLESAEVLEGVFEEGDVYYAGIVAIAPEGAIFADDIVVTVDGKQLEKDMVFGMNQTLVIYYGPVTIGEEGVNPPAVTPPTGELDVLAPMVALVILSGAGIAVMMMLKKRRYY